MRNKILLIILLMGIVLVGGCAKKSCSSICKEIPFSETSSQITQPELNKGWYWGSLDQKKPGTPDDWIHTAEGRRSASWRIIEDTMYGPGYENRPKCDCDKY